MRRRPCPLGAMDAVGGAAKVTCGAMNAETQSPPTSNWQILVRESMLDTFLLWQGCRVIRKHFLTYFALSTIAIAQPILDLYGKNTTVFSAAKMSALEVCVFVLMVLLVPALVTTGIDAISKVFGPRVNEAVRLWQIAAFSFLVGLAIARIAQWQGNSVPIAVGMALAIAVPITFDRFKSVRDWSRWLSALGVAVLATALIQLQPVILGTSGPTSDAVIGRTDVSVLQIVFDEFPLYALLDADGKINAERFPGFAQLAQESTWFRNSVTVSNFTHQAVPAILASQVPTPTGGPFLQQYPKNIFSLFGGKTVVDGIEPVTSLCPPSVCDSQAGSSFGFNVSRYVKFVRDAGYVYGHRVLPPIARTRIPSIEGTWGGFGAVANKFKEQLDAGAFSQVDAIAAGVDALVKDPSSRVGVVHALVPHAPWRLTPDHRVAPLSSSITTQNPDDEEVVRDTYQTFLMQVGVADNAISELMATLKANGRWDNTLLVVTADHGISFLPTMPQRHTDFSDMGQANDVYRIPTFIKYPKQSSGEESDCPISNLDLLPTIIEVTETKTSWEFAGLSVSGECPATRKRTVVSATGETAELTEGFEAVRARSDYYNSIIGREGSLRRVAAVGLSASLVGQVLPASPTSTTVTSWSVTQKSMFANVSTKKGARVPSLITGRIQLSQPLEVGTEGVVAIDGIAAGVIGELSGARDVVSYAAILDYGLLTEGAHTVELFVRLPNGELERVGKTS